jgi:hypothetical protein
VRLKVIEHIYVGHMYDYFNSNMVRLKDLKELSELTDYDLFQFQYGAIKSVIGRKMQVTNIKFQFQYGAIKSTIGNAVSRSNRNFNSNMVRLKAVINDVQI